MIQKTFRPWAGSEWSTAEGEEQQQEWNDRTVYSVDGYNCISELGAKLAPMKVKTDHLTVTAATDLDTMRSDVSTNNGKLTYPAADATKVGFIGVTQAVDLDQMETDIAALANGMVYKGDWDASAGTFPGADVAQTGWFYYVSVAGTVDGVVFVVGDNVVATTDNASTSTFTGNWSHHDQTDAVQSVNGQVGTVVLNADHISDSATTNKYTTAAEITKLLNIETAATTDQTDAEIRTAVEAATDSNVFTDADHAQLATNVTNIALKAPLAVTIVTVSENYTTANKVSKTSVTMDNLGAGDTLTLDDTGLSAGFEGQFFNNTGSDVTLSSAETIKGDNIPIVDGSFCYYILTAANTWEISIGGGSVVQSVVADEPTGSDVIINMVSLTQAEYDAGTPVATTFYVITT